MRAITIKDDHGSSLVVECGWDDEGHTSIWVAPPGDNDGPGVTLTPETVQQLLDHLKPEGSKARRDRQVRQIVEERRATYRKTARRNTNAPTPVERLVIGRDGGRCLRCGEYIIDGERGTAWSIQHRGARGMGGSVRPGVNTTPNLILLCGSGTTGDHGWVEAHPLLASEQGWSISKSADPTLEPVFVAALGRKVFLTANGKYSDEPPQEAA